MMTFKEHWDKLQGKHLFVLMTIAGAMLVGSVNSTYRIWGFSLAIIGNVFWIWYHRRITKDMETMWIFIGYFIINAIAIVNNYFNGIFMF